MKNVFWSYLINIYDFLSSFLFVENEWVQMSLYYGGVFDSFVPRRSAYNDGRDQRGFI